MAKLNILCGLNNMKEFDEVELRVGKVLSEHGYEASFQVRPNKVRIKEYVENNDCDVVVLQEKIDGKKWTAEEVAQLTEQKEINVIIVLSDRYAGKEFMRTLLAANITNAIFQKGRYGGASAKDIADLIMKKRSRKDAREYYGIGGQKLDVGFLDEDTYIEYYNDLRNSGESLIKNYVDVCSKMSPEQIADFTRRLPEDDLDELVKYEEFHTIMQLLKKFKVGKDLNFKKPKRAMVGLKVPQQITFKGYEGETSQSEKIGEPNITKDSEGSNTKLDVSDSDMESMSLEDLLACMSGDYVPKASPMVEEVVEKTIEEPQEAVVSEERPEPTIELPKHEEEKENPTPQFTEEDMARIRAEVAEEEKKKYDEKLREISIHNSKEMEKQRDEFSRRQLTILEEQETDHWKQVTSLMKKQKRLEKELAKVSGEEYILDSGGKQFSWGIILVLILMVVGVVGLLYFKPVLFGASIIW